MSYILAAVNWEQVGILSGMFVSTTSAVLVFVKGRKADQAVASTTMVTTAFDSQRGLVDALQEEVTRHRAIAVELENETRKLRAELNAAALQMENMQRELVSLERENLKHQRKIQELEEEILALRRAKDV